MYEGNIYAEKKNLLSQVLQDTCCKEEITLQIGDTSCRLQVGNIREHSYPVSLFYSHFESWKCIVIVISVIDGEQLQALWSLCFPRNCPDLFTRFNHS